ncbi:MAG: DUF4190 domain-containing protein [Herbiconiux sp.]|nr:DUF4190 domain-containing protein [Herbiconiux sp.]
MTNDTLTPDNQATANPTTPYPAADGIPTERIDSGAPAAPTHDGGTPAYGAQPHGAQTVPPIPATPYYPAQPKTNVLGIVTLVLGVLGFGLVPVITGHIALNQIKRTGEEGRGLTLAGLILGYVTLAGWLLLALFWIGAAGLALIAAAAGTAY